MPGLLSKDTELHYKSGTSAWARIDHLMSVPDMGGDPEQVEVTTLQDGVKKYISGIKDPGSLDFQFLYDNSTVTSNFRILKGLEGTTHEFKVIFPDTSEWAFSAQASVKMDGAEVNAALTFTVSFMLQSDFEVTNPEE
ncbi:MAG: phage tail protein [Gorillibacterium sp.]|nr:phage tail protein [Gorillibacterium sp.]